MKKKKLLTLGLMAVSSVGLAMSAVSCGKKGNNDTPGTDEPSEVIKTLESISVSGAKASFKVGDEFVSTGLVVKARYSDGSELSVSGVVDSSAVNKNAAGTYVITVTYEGLSATYNVTYSPADVVLSSISVSGGAREFTVGDNFSKEGLVVTAHYSNGTTAEVTASVDSSAVNKNAEGTYTITVTYEGVSTTYNVTYKPAPVTLVSLEATGAKTEFYVGDTFITSGLIVTAHYSNGTTAEVTASVDSSAVNKNAAGTYAITVTYEGVSTTYNVTYSAILTGIVIATEPTKKEFYVGDDVSTLGMVVSACYNDGSTKTITPEVDLSRVTKNAVGEYPVILKYEGFQASYTVKYVEAPVTLSSIELSGGARTFYLGEDFNTTGLVVTAVYSNGTKKTVTDYVVDSSAVNKNAESLAKIVVSYTEDGVTKVNKYEVEYKMAPVVLELLFVSGGPREFYVGDDFSSEGIIVSGIYSNDAIEILTSEALVNSSAVNKNTPGVYTIYVSCSGVSTSYDVEYVEEIKVNYSVNGVIVDTKSVSRGDVIQSIDVDEDGYTLEGWYDDSKFTKKHDFSVTPEDTITLYAKLEKNVAVNSGYASNVALYTFTTDDRLTLVYIGNDTYGAISFDLEDGVYKSAIGYNEFGSNKYTKNTFEQDFVVKVADDITFTIDGVDITITFDGAIAGSSSSATVQNLDGQMIFGDNKMVITRDNMCFKRDISGEESVDTTLYTFAYLGYSREYNSTKNEYTLDDNGNMIEIITSINNGYSYTIVQKNSKQYDENGNMILDAIYVPVSEGSSTLVISEYTTLEYDSRNNVTKQVIFRNGVVQYESQYTYYGDIIIEGYTKVLDADGLNITEIYECTRDENDRPVLTTKKDGEGNIIDTTSIECYEDGTIKRIEVSQLVGEDMLVVGSIEYSEDGTPIKVTQYDYGSGQKQVITVNEAGEATLVEIYVNTGDDWMNVVRIEMIFEGDEVVGQITYTLDPDGNIVYGEKNTPEGYFIYDIENDQWILQSEED